MKYEWVRVPVIEPINPADFFEHTPLDWRKGEYPRFIRPVGPRLGDHPWRWERRPSTVPGEQNV